MKRSTFFALLAIGFGPSTALANCHWEWFCNGDGACKQMPLCDSVNETPPPKPDSEPPAMPPIAMRPHRIPGPMGALTCEHIMRKLGNGKWHWVEICYCTDPERSKDSTPPFAYIVRCDAAYKEKSGSKGATKGTNNASNSTGSDTSGDSGFNKP
jgi:hypothetical protein